ncbi:calumenin-B-like isoform X1 [Acanthaster planci]|uniref:Reticulocalbin-3 n=1 Tax=Acanthaster planci TaxID=133434 RepID=A0A8B7ZMP8_ACAPL|nr:calumenin-B-like isoform X1 [Acanthaster planci]
MKGTAFAAFVCVLLVVAFAKPAEKQDEHKRVKDAKLSDEEHFEGKQHNVDYDHDAFLGEEEAKTFQNLSPEESRKRLGMIVDKIDEDKDGFVTEEELRKWIEHQQEQYFFEDAGTLWKSHNPDSDDQMTWEEYNSTTYSSLAEEELVKLPENERMDFAKMIRRDKARWASADENKDGILSREEFTAFLHPENFDRMRGIVVQETLEDVDKDGDGKISLEEYIGDMYRENNDGAEEPEWVKTEREQFAQFRDKNHDGFMDLEEVGEWILPTEYDHIEAEAKHLIFEADKDKDKKLTKKEIIDNYDLFVGSQATNYGESLQRHDEF